MSESKTEANPAPGRMRPTAWHVVLAVLFKVVLPAVVLLVALSMAYSWMTSSPKAPRQPRERQARLVQVVQVEAEQQVAVIEAMGHVLPARDVALKPQVAGRVVWVNDDLVPGTFFEAGAELVRIERVDYEIALARAESNLNQARTAVTEAERGLVLAKRDLQLEMGSQAVAKKEYELLGDSIDPEATDLVLRKPQLEAAKADVTAAEAQIAASKAGLEAARLALRDAELALERTSIVAPFNCVVQSKQVAIGDTVGTSTVVAELMGTDTFWVELSVPERDLRWVEPPGNGEEGALVRLYNEAAWGPAACREGRVLRRLPTVDDAGRMVKLLVAVDDPLSREPSGEDQPVLLVGSYLRGEVEGQAFENVVALPRTLLHEGDTVRVMNGEGLLEIRSVHVLFRGRDMVLIRDGLAEGERVLLTDLAAPVAGMPLRVEGDPVREASGEGQPGSRAEEAEAGEPTQPASAKPASGKEPRS